MIIRRPGDKHIFLPPGLIRVRGGKGGGVSSLLTDLISYWKLDETSGTRNDAHGTNHLTDNNTVLSAAGKIGNAADFEATNNEFLSITDNASLSMGDIDFSISVWVNAESLSPTDGNTIIFKGVAATLQGAEYGLLYRGANNRWRWVVGNGVVGTAVNADSLGIPAVATWYFIVCWHDASANTINIQVNNGTVDSAAHTAGSYDSTVSLVIGRLADTSAWHFDGLIDEAGLWKRVLTAAERTSLYAGGSGLAYPFS